jgi:hypothetical protein
MGICGEGNQGQTSRAVVIYNNNNNNNNNNTNNNVDLPPTFKEKGVC